MRIEIRNISLATAILVLSGAAAMARASAPEAGPAAAVTPANDMSVAASEKIRFGGGRVAELYAGRRPSAKEDQRDWLVVKLSEVGMVVVGDDGKTEVLAIDKFGGVYINGDLYVKGEKFSGAKVAAVDASASASGSSRWFVLLMFVLSVATSTAIALGLRKRQ